MIFLISSLVTIGVAICGIWLAYRYGILDRPGADIQPPRGPVPTLQGIGIIVSFFLIVGLLFPAYYLLPSFQAIVRGGSIILVFAVIDERCFLYPKIKQTWLVLFSYASTRFVIMIIIGMIAYRGGGVMFDELSIGGIILYLPVRASIVATVMRFILSINAVNRIDGINGISTGVASIGFLTIYLLITRVVIPLYVVIEPEVIMAQQLSGILFVISVIYAYIEWKPLALVRDVGVMFLGFMLAYLSLLGGGKIGIMIVALALVIFDAAWVIINRLVIMRKNPLKGDYTHLHHRLLRLGRSRSEVRVFVRGRSIFLMIIMLLQGDQTINKFIIFVVMACIFFGVNIYLFWIKKLPYELLKKKS